jgi:hypothetical protein
MQEFTIVKKMKINSRGIGLLIGGKGFEKILDAAINLPPKPQKSE